MPGLPSGAGGFPASDDGHPPAIGGGLQTNVCGTLEPTMPNARTPTAFTPCYVKVFASRAVPKRAAAKWRALEARLVTP